MPELPEVETIRRGLVEEVVGRRITGAHLLAPWILKAPAPEDFLSAIAGRTVERVDRAAKYLLVHLSGGWTWVIHLMLEGQLLYVEPQGPTKPDTMLVVELDNGMQLRLRDVTGYARIQLLRTDTVREALKLDAFGPEPIDPDFTFELFQSRLERRKGMVKPLLLNQQVLAGLGNIYVDEALYRARIHPARKVNSLDEAERRRLYEAVVHVLEEGIKNRGTSARGGRYRDLWGKKGEHQAHLQVFRREGQPCPDCDGVVEKITLGGRSTFYCPYCQTL